MVRARYLKLFLILLLVSGVTACIRQLPAFKREAKRQSERMTRETQEAIKKNPKLQELENLCAKQIPLPEGFVLTQLGRDFHESKFLAYHYRSKERYDTVKQFYLTYFGKQNWQLTSQKDKGWGPSHIEFRNETYQVKIYDLEEFDGPVYGIVCSKL